MAEDEDRPSRESGHSGYAFEKREGEQSRTILWFVMGGFLLVGAVGFIVFKPSLHHHHSSQLDKLKATVDVAEVYYANVAVGDKVTFETDVYPGRKFEGQVSRINPAINAGTRTFSVEVTIPNKDRELLPGMSSRAIFNLSEHEAVIVPAVAVKKQIGSSERYVYVIKDGKAEYRFVNDGKRMDENIEIIDGVEAGEQVAITGISKLLDGCDVEVVK
jgi:RND family efflux transporter MFP subunit